MKITIEVERIESSKGLDIKMSHEGFDGEDGGLLLFTSLMSCICKIGQESEMPMEDLEWRCAHAIQTVYKEI